MNWEAPNLDREWCRFQTHCSFTFDGPLNSKTEREKVNYLMTFIGDRGREIYETFQWEPATDINNPAENHTLAGVYKKYEEYVTPRKNPIRATLKFNRRKQDTGERFEDFVTALRLLIRDCEYTDDNRMLRDAIVLRSVSSTVTERCLEQGTELTLEKAITIGRNHEISQSSMRDITGEDSSVNLVNKPLNKNKHMSRPTYQSQGKRLCNKCGYTYSDRHERCPAKDATCNYCNNRGHFISVCRKRKQDVNVVEQTEDDSDGEWSTHMISSVDSNTSSMWWQEIIINGKSVQVQIDTGASKSIMPLKTYEQLCPSIKLKKSSSKLRSYTNHQLTVLGSCTVPITYKDRTAEINFEVVDINQKTLLSGEASLQLNLIERVYTIHDYPETRLTTGMLPGTYTIKIDETVPPVVHGPRRQPKALIEKVKAKLTEMEKDGHIAKVAEPTDWVSSMVTVVRNNKVRICIDPKDLNKAIKREHYPIPTIQEVVTAMPPDSKVFSVLDAKSGYMQICLDHESSMLTTFNTPIGRYRWLRLPFGVKCAPEAYQKIMDTMLENIEGARAIMDDILIAGRNETEHDIIIRQVIERATEYNLKLNFEKCQVKQNKVKYVGHILTENGLQPDDEKIRAVKDMPTPTSKEEVRRFLGFIQYLSKFIPNLSTVDAPLRELIRREEEFHWDKPQIKSLAHLKELCCQAPVLAYYDPKKASVIQCDASSYALGGVLLQEGRPIAYTSRAMSVTEQRYAQIEKETLAIVHSCRKFHYYVFGRPVKIESDHKPLQAIFSKPMLAAPMRLQSMMLRLQPYDIEVKYKPGKEIPIGDALSRANLPEAYQELELELINTVDHVAVSPTRYAELQATTKQELQNLYTTILNGWPATKRDTPPSIRHYWGFRDELTVSDNIIYKGMRIVVPPSLYHGMLLQIHDEAHLGIVKCKQRAREALYWPGMMADIETIVSECPECNKYPNKQCKESLLQTPTPEYPWQEIAADIFEWKGQHYIVLMDYLSKFIEVEYLSDLRATTTIKAVKSQICRHGIPEKIRTDNGPQFSAQEFKLFCTEFHMQHETSSPHFPQSNGAAERAVQIVKRLWAKCKDKDLALLSYRTTPLESCNLSPAQLCMSRRPRNLIPTASALLQPIVLNLKDVRTKLERAKLKQKLYYDKKGARDLSTLVPGDRVHIAPKQGEKGWIPATVRAQHHNPRSYIVDTGNGVYRRNRRDIRMRQQLTTPIQSHIPIQQLVTPIQSHVPVQQPVTPIQSHVPVQQPVTPIQSHVPVQQPVTPIQSQSVPVQQWPVTSNQPQSATMTKSGRKVIAPAKLADYVL